MGRGRLLEVEAYVELAGIVLSIPGSGACVVPGVGSGVGRGCSGVGSGTGCNVVGLGVGSGRHRRW